MHVKYTSTVTCNIGRGRGYVIKRGGVGGWQGERVEEEGFAGVDVGRRGSVDGVEERGGGE